MNQNCRFCGAPKNWQELIEPVAPWERQAVGSGWSRYSNFNAGTVSAALQSGATYEKRKPVRAARLESDVWVPAAQSLISGGVGAVTVAGIAALAGQGWRSLLFGVVGGAASVGLAWAVLLGEHRRALWEVERIIGRDINGDGAVGRPAPVGKREPVRVEVVERNERGHTRRMRWADLPPDITDDDLEQIAVAVLTDEKPFSTRGVKGIMGADKFAGLSRAMRKGGLAVFKNGQNANGGVILSGSGRAFLRQYLA